MNYMQILSIETSCDETAAAVVEKNGGDIKILSNVIASQIEIHKKYGGVFPEHASRAHAEKIIPVVEEALGKSISCSLSVTHIKNKNILVTSNSILDTIDCIAITTGPGLIGSLLIGVNFAKTLAFAKKLPIVGINHWLGHIYSNWAQKPFPQFPALILIASGGHTGLVLMKSHNKIIPLGETLDDAAGEAFDKIAKLLGLGYPGGPAISKAAEKGDPKAYNFPRSMLERKDFDFSFSGLKTAVLYESRKHNLKNQVKANLAASFQQAVIDILVGKTIHAAYEFRPKSICLCGGVSANKELREQLKKAVAKLPWKTSYHVPPIELSTDNAAMIGIAAAYHLNDKTTYDKITADANLKL
jgi:N6-L-threonylcarbamoyladenine synthase